VKFSKIKSVEVSIIGGKKDFREKGVTILFSDLLVGNFYFICAACVISIETRLKIVITKVNIIYNNLYILIDWC
jgi:hypothetical protein